MTIRFGGKTIDLVFPGKNHANDGTAVLFRDERVLFTTDFPADALVQNTMRSMPSACGPFDGHPMDEWIKSYRTIEALDFDISVGGHGTVPFTKADIAEGREFFEYLKREVQAAMSKGMSLEQMKKTLMLEPYKDWRHYAAAARIQHRSGVLQPQDLQVAHAASGPTSHAGDFGGAGSGSGIGNPPDITRKSAQGGHGCLAGRFEQGSPCRS